MNSNPQIPQTDPKKYPFLIEVSLKNKLIEVSLLGINRLHSVIKHYLIEFSKFIIYYPICTSIAMHHHI